MQKSKRKTITGPTVLTIIRMVLAVVFLVLMVEFMTYMDCEPCSPFITCLSVNCEPNYAVAIAALAVFIVAAVTDKIDGIWARKKNLVTDMGAFLDPLADKMLVDAALLVLLMMNLVPIWLVAIILWRDLAVDGMRMMLARKGITLAASIWGKIKTLTQMIMLTVILLNIVVMSEALEYIGVALIIIVAILTVVSGMEILIKGWKKLKA